MKWHRQNTEAWRKSLQNREIAREAIYKCVNNHRKTGLKTMAALEEMAPHVGVSQRRIRSLFFNEDIAPMAAAERHQILNGVANAHFWLARQLRAWADEIEAETKQQQERERNAWLNDISGEASV